MPIIINDIEISDDDVHAEMQHHPASGVDEARHRAARALVIRKLLLLEAVETKLLKTSENCTPEEEEQAIDALLQEHVTAPIADDTYCSRYYEQNKEHFMDKKTNKVLPFEMVRQYIHDYLQTRSLQTGINQYIKILAGKAKIIGFELDGADSPLVQ